MSPLKIAIITYNWPPRNAIGTHRPYSWAKYWSEAGAKVTVVTAKKGDFDSPLDLHLPPLPDVKVFEVDYLPALKRKLGFFRSALIRRIMKRVKVLLVKQFKVELDPRQNWVRSASSLVKRLSTEVDVVVSTYGPAATHLLANQMKVNNHKLVWVADYRDLWSLNHLSDLHPTVKNKQSEVEKETVGDNADYITTVSSQLADDLSNFIGKNVTVITNGFDISESEIKKNLKSSLGHSGAPVRIVHTGMLYEGHRDPSPLFSAIYQLHRDGVLKDGDLTVDFFGDRTDLALDLARKMHCTSFVRLMGHVSREEALRAQQNANLLLLLESASRDAKGVLTGKIFEYIAAGRPILSIGSQPESAIFQLLSATGTGLCVGTDTDLIKAQLLAAFDVKKPTWFSPQISEIMLYSRQNQADKMYRLFEAGAVL